MTVQVDEHRRDWGRGARLTVGVLSVCASLAVGFIALIGFMLMSGDGTNLVLVNALFLSCFLYAGIAGYLGYRTALRSWAWWSLWAIVSMVIVPIAFFTWIGVLE